MYLIFDSSVIIQLTKSNLLNNTLSLRSVGRLVLPATVYREIFGGEKTGQPNAVFQELVRQRLFELFENDPKALAELEYTHPSLGMGELGALEIALRLKRSSNRVVVLTDDRKARKTARELGLDVHGTLWIMIQLKSKHAITREKAVTVAAELPSKGFHITEHELAKAIEKIERDC